jgi:hypothetical protein
MPAVRKCRGKAGSLEEDPGGGAKAKGVRRVGRFASAEAGDATEDPKDLREVGGGSGNRTARYVAPMELRRSA